jgi:predicted nucleic acid-binding protein
VNIVVVDASLALALVYQDESSRQIETLLRAMHGGSLTLLAPAHWQIEVASSLQRGARRKRIHADARAPSFALLAALPISIVNEFPSALELFALADEASLSVYDALYLWLALKERALAATADRSLASSAAKRGVLWQAQGRRR